MSYNLVVWKRVYCNEFIIPFKCDAIVVDVEVNCDLQAIDLATKMHKAIAF